MKQKILQNMYFLFFYFRYFFFDTKMIYTDFLNSVEFNAVLRTPPPNILFSPPCGCVSSTELTIAVSD